MDSNILSHEYGHIYLEMAVSSYFFVGAIKVLIYLSLFTCFNFILTKQSSELLYGFPCTSVYKEKLDEFCMT